MAHGELLYVLKLYFYTIISTLLFLHGFFPVAVKTPPSRENTHCKFSNNIKPAAERLVLIVIDALRLDFVNSSKMPHSSKIAEEEGCFISLQVHSPTVTLPRIKALTTGDVPQFIDIALNLLSTETLDNSVLHRMKDADKKLVFYGDDTWLKLYPDVFIRHEGVSSFYVNDYTEVDNNVTRNVLEELNKDDWDVMILHYLGLDHIGHIQGPFVKLIDSKLSEMDEIIKNVHSKSKLWDKKTLILITGDHGMKDSGGHGGATFSETNVPLIVVGIPCNDGSAIQVDISPTLSALFAVDIPSATIGSVIPNMLTSYSLNELLYIMKCNAIHLQTNHNFAYQEDVFEKAMLKHYDFLKSNNSEIGKEAFELYNRYNSLAKEKLINLSVDQNFNQLVFSLVLLLHCCISILKYAANLEHANVNIINFGDIFILAAIIIYMYILSNCFILLIFAFSVILQSRNISLKAYFKAELWNYAIIFKIGCILHLVSLFSSSFIEEEHQIWYYFWSTILCLFFYSFLSQSPYASFHFAIVLSIFCFIRKLNQTGDKWAHLPDISQWLLADKNYLYLHIFIITSLILTFLTLASLSSSNGTYSCITSALIITYVFKIFSPQNHFLHKLHCFIMSVILFLSIRNKNLLNGVIAAWVVNSTLLFRSYNIILLPSCIITGITLKRFIKDEKLLIFSYIWLGNALFFCQGHSNSLASVDVASGYNGLSDYNPLIVIFQVLCHTYTFPVLCNLLALKHCNNQCQVWVINIVCRTLILTVTVISTMLQRHHLFIWTVFAPKLLIEAIHSIVLFVECVLYSLSYVNLFPSFNKNN